MMTWLPHYRYELNFIQTNRSQAKDLACSNEHHHSIQVVAVSVESKLLNHNPRGLEHDEYKLCPD